VDIDAFFAAVEVMLNPDLKGKPVIVGGRPDERGVVCTASYEARKFGVHSGMALQTAAKKCPGGVFLRGRSHVYHDISKKFFKCLAGFSPVMEEVSVDEAYLDLRGTGYLFRSVYEMARKIKAAVEREIGLKVSVGLGFSKLGAKMATEMAKPGGIFFLLHEKLFLSDLSLGKIPGVGPNTWLILQGLGVKRVSQLERDFPQIWKKVMGPHLYSSARYPAGRTVREKSFSRETTFPMDISREDLVMAHLAYLVDRLSVCLIENRLYAGRLEVKVRFGDFSTVCRRVSLPFPTFSYPVMWQTARNLLQKLIKRSGRSVRLVGVKVEELTAGRGLLPFVSIRSEQVSRALKRIKDRYGFSAIYSGREMLLEELYPVEPEGVVLKTASLTK
jgi:DNA polymerase-4